ncbi:hypothetical protein MTR67_020958 [Solanum verrucosum]|uniref:Uncharacterized protein n=1 Tax=Solanum verrucosum TaxID=315347 RepID=A0AAF0QSN0_SOLVR|nr:hypothetical protein MTR67_020958 [Solanum verrucosum]
MYSSYALAIWNGARFILGKGYTGGQVLNVFDVKLLHSVASDLLLKGEFSSKMCDAGGELTMHGRNDGNLHLAREAGHSHRQIVHAADMR